MRNSDSGLAMLLGLILFFIGLIGFPLLEIWAINTVFDTEIAYNFINWLGFTVINFIISVFLN